MYAGIIMGCSVVLVSGLIATLWEQVQPHIQFMWQQINSDHNIIYYGAVELAYSVHFLLVI